MAIPLRMFEPKKLYFITNRTFQGRLLLTPSTKINNIIGFYLAKSLEIFDVKIFSYVFLSNHFHIIIQAPEGKISDFMAYFQSNVARTINSEYKWSGALWHGRFSAEPILDDEALIGRIRYIFAHGVKEGLVEKCVEWPGLSSAKDFLTGGARIFRYYDKTDKEEKEYKLKLTQIPQWIGLGFDEVKKRVKALIKEAEEWGKKSKKFSSVLGVENVKKQNPHTRPKNIKESIRPLCHTTRVKLYKEYKQIYMKFVELYREASVKFRSGDLFVKFPKYAFRPPLPYSIG